MLSEYLKAWLVDHAGVLFSAVSGAVIHMMVAWQNPVIAARQLVAGTLSAINLGPLVYEGVIYATPFGAGENVLNGTICAVGIGGVYLAEAIIFLWKRWAANPTIPLPWRKNT